MPHAHCNPEARRAADRFFTAAVWLAVVLVGVKAWYLHIASDPGAHYVSSLAAISYVDVVFAAAVWAGGRAALSLAGTGRAAERMLWVAFLWFSAFSCLYALANVLAFPVFGAFLTYPLVALISDVRMIRSSVAAQLTRSVLLGLVCLPLVYLALVHVTNRLLQGRRVWRLHRGIVIASLVAWVGGGAHAFAVEWAWRQDHRIAESLHWVFLSSWWRAFRADATARMSDRFPNGDLADFEPCFAAHRAPRGRSARSRRGDRPMSF